MLTLEDVAGIRHLKLPSALAFRYRRGAVTVTSEGSSPELVDVMVAPFRTRGPTCSRALATLGDGRVLGLDFAQSRSDFAGANPARVVRHRTPPAVVDNSLDLSGGAFLDIPSSPQAAQELREAALRAWGSGIRYVAALGDGTAAGRPGLRKPQLGALHALAAHWSLNRDPALVVLPTGTGKTEVLLAASIAAAGDRVLVVVPTDALRSQTARKFSTYGLLGQLGVISDIPKPVVGVIQGRISESDFETIELCNVVVTTMSSIARASEDVQRSLAQLFSDVYFDEAHHLESQTWKSFSALAAHARCTLFTATPFREDGKALPGKMIYNFPLHEAQVEGYFQPIQFIQVFEPDSEVADAAIAEAAVGQLRDDLGRGYDHLLLARTDTVARAERLLTAIYQARHPDLNPVVVHSAMPNKAHVLESIRSLQHKIIICVDMFGEGYDLPNLKIAALHSVHKSLGITLQFIGRFTRTAGQRLGPASFVANTAEDGVPESLESLYQEDADWNSLVSDLSHDAINPQAQLSALVQNLELVQDAASNIQISALTLKPKMSAQVFRSTDFLPHNFASAFRRTQKIHQPRISREDRMLVLVVNQRETIDWTDSRDISLEVWDLYVAYFVEAQGLLFIHSSRKGDSGFRLARVLSSNPILVRDDEVFKSFTHLRRLVLHSVGLTSLSKNVRYQMFVGLDVRQAIDPIAQRDKLKSNVTGIGYEEGTRTSVGCSRKGKIWSLTTGSLAEWKQWCERLAAKLSQEGEPEDFLKHTLIPEPITTLPAQHPLMIDWPEQVFESATFKFTVLLGEHSFDFHDCELRLGDWTLGGGHFIFQLVAGDEQTADLRFELLREPREGSSYSVTQVGGEPLNVKAFGESRPAAEFFMIHPPMVRLADGSQLSGEILLKPREGIRELYDAASIQTIDWAGVDLRAESRWKDGALRVNSIQQRFIEHLEQTTAAFIIDDDDCGESADVVAIEETEQQIAVTLWHCKYSDDVGNRADDLYEVCGQAQKSVKWAWSLQTLVKHLVERETKHGRGRPSRFVRGTPRQLVSLRKGSRRKFVIFKVGIVQPGLRRETIPDEHLAILGATSHFLRTVTGHPLKVVAGGG